MRSPTFTRLASATLVLALLVIATRAPGVTELPKLLQPGVAVKDLSGEGGEGVVYRFIVPEGAKNLTFQSYGGTGDCDLFVRRAAHPTTGDFDGSSEDGGTREKVTFAEPAAGVWYLLVKGYGSYSGVVLTARFTSVPATEPVVKFLPAPGTYPSHGPSAPAGAIRIDTS